MDKNLHFMRVREKDTPVFTDPSADLGSIVTAGLDAVFELMDTTDPQVRELKGYMQVYNTRLLEDPQPLIKQYIEFQQALNGFSRRCPEIMSEFLYLFTQYILSAYALLLRRDGKIQPDDSYKFKSGCILLALMPGISFGAAKELSEYIPKFAGYKPELLASEATAVTKDQVKRLEQIKAAARGIVGATAAMTWEETADKCDKYFSTSQDAEHSTEDNIKVALAYPSYNEPCDSVEVSDDTDRD